MLALTPVRELWIRLQKSWTLTVAGRYENPIPSRFLAPIDCSKIPAQLWFTFPVCTYNLYQTLVHLVVFFHFSLNRSQTLHMRYTRHPSSNSERSDLRFEAWQPVFLTRYMGYDWSLEREICKTILKLVFTAHVIMEVVSEFGLIYKV
jgi:hypothetical protein